jgi:hypothetical protein
MVPIRRMLFVLAVTCIAVSPAKASVMYSYHGKIFATASGVLTTSDLITGTVVFDNPLPDTGFLLAEFFPTSFSFNVGPHLTITDLNETVASFRFNVVSQLIFEWDVNLSSAAGQIHFDDFGGSVNIVSPVSGTGTEFPLGSGPGDRGWSFPPTQVPEPVTSSLLALGLSSFAGRKWVRKWVARRRVARRL